MNCHVQYIDVIDKEKKNVPKSCTFSYSCQITGKVVEKAYFDDLGASRSIAKLGALKQHSPRGKEKKWAWVGGKLTIAPDPKNKHFRILGSD